MFPRSLIAGLCLLIAVAGALAYPTPTPPPAPASLAVPADQKLAFTLTAGGMQNYECRAVPGVAGKFEWAFTTEEADLFDARGRKVGHLSTGPTWELIDGGKVVGRIKVKVDAPDRNGLPWLLLDAVQASGGGIMSRVRSIRRINTAGGEAGVPPTRSGSPGWESVGYTATYEFYVAKP